MKHPFSTSFNSFSPLAALQAVTRQRMAGDNVPELNAPLFGIFVDSQRTALDPHFAKHDNHSILEFPGIIHILHSEL